MEHEKANYLTCPAGKAPWNGSAVVEQPDMRRTRFASADDDHQDARLYFVTSDSPDGRRSLSVEGAERCHYPGGQILLRQ